MAKRQHPTSNYKRRLLTFIGAFIVFATFIFKEGFREQLKDLVDSINNAENVFFIRKESSQLPVFLGLVDLQITRLSDRLDKSLASKTARKTGSHTPTHVSLIAEMDLVYVAMDSLDVSLNNLMRLVETLPKNNYVMKEASGLEKEAAHLRDDGKSLRESIAGAMGYGDDNDVDVLQNAPFKVSAFYSKTQEVSTRVKELEHKAIERAEILRRENEYWYTVCRWMSYGLYGLGWGLGLVGRLYHVEGIVESE